MKKPTPIGATGSEVMRTDPIQTRCRTNDDIAVRQTNEYDGIVSGRGAVSTASMEQLHERGPALSGTYISGPDGKFREVDAEFAKLCGYSSPKHLLESVGNVATEFYVPSNGRDTFLREIALVGSVSGLKTQVRRGDGTEIWVREDSSAVRDESGRVSHFTGSITEITPQSEVQRRSQTGQGCAVNDQDRIRDQRKDESEFLAGITHELRTPLNGIVTMLDLMNEELLPAKQRKYLQVARRSATIMLAMANEILESSRIESGCLELESAPFSLGELIGETSEILCHRAEAKGVQLNSTIDASVPEMVMGDRIRIQQVLMNLISNAIKFTDEGSVEIAADVVERRWLRIKVRDTGIGIFPDRQKSIFERFTQAEPSTARRFGGSGLGLSICRQLILLMHGKIDVESEVNVGTTFTCTIPLTAAGEHESSGSETSPAPWNREFPANEQDEVQVSAADSQVLPNVGRGSILVVDDNQINTIVASEVLETMGFGSNAVSSGEAAIKRAQESVFDAILMDCEMPGMDGFDATGQLRRLHRRGQLKLASDQPLRIIALTAQVDEAQIKRCIRSGMDAYLPKPISSPEFGRVIRHVLGIETNERDAGYVDAPVDSEWKANVAKNDPPLVWNDIVRRCGDSHEFSCDVMRLFKDQLPTQLADLKVHVASGDLSAASAQSHRIKGAAATMAAVPIATLAGSIEQSLRGGRADGIDPQLTELETEVGRCLNWIDEKLVEMK